MIPAEFIQIRTGLSCPLYFLGPRDGGRKRASECKKHLENDQKKRMFPKCNFLTQNTDVRDDRQTDRNNQWDPGVHRRPLGTAWIVIAYHIQGTQSMSKGMKPRSFQVLCPRNSLSAGTGVRPLAPHHGGRYPAGYPRGPKPDCRSRAW